MNGRSHTVGLRSDGTVVAVGSNDNGQCNVSSWSNIAQVAAGTAHSVGLKDDASVVDVGNNDYGQLNVGSWNLKVNPDPEEFWTPQRMQQAVPIPNGRIAP